MSEDWKTGDLGVKVGGPCRIIPKGAVVRVVTVHPGHMRGDREIGLVLKDWQSEPGCCSCFTAHNFRKLNDEPDDIELIERIKGKKPATSPVQQEQGA